MKTVVWSELAHRRLVEIAATIAEYAGEQSAIRYVSEFNRLVDLAAANPEMGKTGVVPDTRELFPIGGKYRIVYRVTCGVLYVLTVKSVRQLHTAETFMREWSAR